VPALTSFFLAKKTHIFVAFRRYNSFIVGIGLKME